MPQRKTIKVSGVQAVILLITSIFLGLCFVFLTVCFPKIADDSFITKLMGLICVTPFLFATLGIPGTLSIKVEMGNLSFSILIIIFGLITSIFAYYFGHNKPDLYDFINRKLTVSFFLFIPFLCFSFGFLVLSNTLLWRFGSQAINIRNPKIFSLLYTGSMSVFLYSRFIFPLACVFLFQPLLGAFRIFLQTVFNTN